MHKRSKFLALFCLLGFAFPFAPESKVFRLCHIDEVKKSVDQHNGMQ